MLTKSEKATLRREAIVRAQPARELLLARRRVIDMSGLQVESDFDGMPDRRGYRRFMHSPYREALHELLLVVQELLDLRLSESKGVVQRFDADVRKVDPEAQRTPRSSRSAGGQAQIPREEALVRSIQMPNTNNANLTKEQLLEKTIEELKARIDTLTKDNSQLHDLVMELDSRIRDVDKDTTAKCDDVEKEVKDSIEDIRREVSDVSGDVATVNNNISDIEKNVKACDARIGKVQDNVDDVQKNLDSLKELVDGFGIS